MTKLTTIFKDERGDWSAARVFLFIWLANAAAYVWQRPDSVSLGAVLTFFTAIGTPLIVWTAGPRIAQYLGPQVGSVVAGVAESAKSLAQKVAARRNPEHGFEETK